MYDAPADYDEIINHFQTSADADQSDGASEKSVPGLQCIFDGSNATNSYENLMTFDHILLSSERLLRFFSSVRW